MACVHKHAYGRPLNPKALSANLQTPRGAFRLREDSGYGRQRRPGLGMRASPSSAVLYSPGKYGTTREKRERVRPPSHLVPARSAPSRADWVQDWVQIKRAWRLSPTTSAARSKPDAISEAGSCSDGPISDIDPFCV